MSQFDFSLYRSFMTHNIADILPRVSSSPGTESLDLNTATNLESLLYKESYKLEEYMNQKTLSSRVKMLLARQATKEPVHTNKSQVPQKGRRSEPEEQPFVVTCPKRRRTPSKKGQSECLLPWPKRRRTLGVTLTAEQVRDHLAGLRLYSPEKEKEKDETICSLCGMGTLLLSPNPNYCSSCGFVIKHGRNYYTTQVKAEVTEHKDSIEPHIFCRKCFMGTRGKLMTTLGGDQIPKNSFFVAKNRRTEELWVLCKTCNQWNHQICGLFNDQNNYTCLKCRLKAMESKDYIPSSDDPFLLANANNLPQTILGDFIQDRLLRRLRQDREERAKAAGKSFDEVPGADDLLVKVVLSVKKTLAANNSLLSFLQDENYPTEFPYTTKMILLFQKIDGVDVVLFGMYVQEYGSDCRGPNHRYAYIAYIDSAKYFRPDIRASTGEALRTMAYHEMLISYLYFVKKRGFARCYLWCCPPLKGNQYILNCHPANQKTPNSNRLRQWYQKMLRKAIDEGIVVNQTTLFDRFFDRSRGSSNCKITAARLPYLDGDYLPGIVENLVKNVETEMKENAKNGVNNAVTNTSLKALGFTNPSDATNKDVLLMEKIKDAIDSFKDDLMVIDLQYVCAHCHDPILSGKRWICAEAKTSAYLCQRCHDLHDKHKNSVSENEICESRQKFLEFCQENQYQFDTLRRTKHSTMKIIHKISPRTRGQVTLSDKQIPDLMKILRHLRKCRPEKTGQCGYRGCKGIRAMILHATKCGVGANGGCVACQKVWYMLFLHSQQCRESKCQFPHCMKLKIKYSVNHC